MVWKILLCAVIGLLALMAAGWWLADWLTPRAVGEPSQALAVEAEETPLDRAIAPLLADHPGQSGALMLVDGLDAFAFRAATAAHAGRTLDVQYYIWRDDVTGHLLARELWRAAQRGVRVRFLVDDLTIRGADRKLLALGAHENIEIRVYNPVRNRGGVMRMIEMVARSLSLNYRMHNKAWIVDGRIAIVGGRNIGVEYFSASTNTNFHDLDVALLGPVVDQASAIFDRFWNSEAVVPINALMRKPGIDLDTYLAEVDRESDQQAAQAYLTRLAETILMDDWMAEPTIHWGDSLQLVSDPPIKRGGSPADGWLVGLLREQMRQAEQQALFISPYFVPGEDFADWLTAQARTGLDVGVVTNSLAATDVLAVHSGYAPYRRPLLTAGVRLHELRRQPGGEHGRSLFGSRGASLHTKAYVLDERLGFIGSFNLDQRSAWLNTEMGLLFDHAGLARAVQDEYRHLTLDHMSYEVSLDKDGDLRWQDRLVDPPQVLHTEPDSSLAQRVLIWLLGWLPIESQL